MIYEVNVKRNVQQLYDYQCPINLICCIDDKLNKLNGSNRYFGLAMDPKERHNKT